MSRQSKNRAKAAASNRSKGQQAGAHFREDQARPACPHQQPKPCWMHSKTSKPARQVEGKFGITSQAK